MAAKHAHLSSMAGSYGKVRREAARGRDACGGRIQRQRATASYINSVLLNAMKTAYQRSHDDVACHGGMKNMARTHIIWRAPSAARRTGMAHKMAGLGSAGKKAEATSGNRLSWAMSLRQDSGRPCLSAKTWCRARAICFCSAASLC